ncbi:head GIN domain-containing protein [Flavobacterium sp. XGLA_31]|uniref:head GIN domain-containing protein n=1 Tax=Flavobacterium sp. XGLA_31 TaxID=3447666 RepID=UPI003F2DE723
MVKFVVLRSNLIAAALVALTCTACQTHINLGNGIDGNGNVTSETRNVGNNFTKIDVSRGLTVTLERDDNYKVEVEADENLQNHITTRTENGTLFISTDENIDEASAKNVHVKMPTLTAIEASSGSSVSTYNTFKGTDLFVKSSSGSNAELTIEFDNIKCETTSGSSLTVKGKALQLKTASSSGSTIDAGQLLVNDVIAEATSGSNINVHPIVSLNGKASSGSSVDYRGNPKTVTKEETSGGSVSKE